MIVVIKNPVPCYEVTCDECKSVIHYKRSEADITVLARYLDSEGCNYKEEEASLICPVCGIRIANLQFCPTGDEAEGEQMNIPDDLKTAYEKDYEQGIWIADGNGHYHCSICGYIVDNIYTCSDLSRLGYFCRNCGAEMDGMSSGKEAEDASDIHR